MVELHDIVGASLHATGATNDAPLALPNGHFFVEPLLDLLEVVGFGLLVHFSTPIEVRIAEFIGLN